MSVNKCPFRIRKGFIKTGEDFTKKKRDFQKSLVGTCASTGPKLAPLACTPMTGTY